MKVLVIGRTLPSKSDIVSGIFEFEQAKGLHEKNYDVVYGFVDNRSIKVMRKVKKINSIVDGIQTIGYYLPIGGIPKIVYDKIKYILFKKLYKQTIKYFGKPDIIHVHFPIININNEIIDFIVKQNAKMIVTEHWSKVLKMELTRREKNILKCLLSKSEKIIAVSKKLADILNEYNEKFERPYKDEFIVIPNLINSTYDYTPLSKNENFTFATVGRLVPMKGNEFIIKAFIGALEKKPNLRLYIIGDGPERRRLRSLIKRLNLNDKVIITGFLEAEKVKELYKEINVYITASQIETFGVPVIEAWMIGRPVIISDNHPMMDWLNKSNGLMYKTDENRIVKNLENKMTEIYSVNYDNKSISNKCLADFSRNSILDKLDHLYKII